MIFVSWGDYFGKTNRENRSRLLTREEYHVKNLHSIDMLLLMLMRFLCWFNPLYGKYSRELRLVNEYAADRAVMRTVGIREYMRTIVDTQGWQHEESKVLSFGFDGNKYMSKRIAMIRRYGDECYTSGLRLFCIVPASMLLLLLAPSFVIEYCHLPEVITTLL